MTRATWQILAVALAAGLVGLGAGLLGNGPGPLLRSEPGQRAVQAALSSGAAPAAVPVAARGQLLPAFTLPRLDGAAFALPAALAGRPALINVWATWCAPCVHEMPELQRFARAQGANGVQVVGIALDDAAAVTRFLQQVPVDYPILLDTPGDSDAGVRLGNARGVLPYTVLLDARGVVRRQRLGPFEAGEVDAWVAETGIQAHD